MYTLSLRCFKLSPISLALNIFLLLFTCNISMFIEMFVYTSPNISMLKVYIILCKMMIDYNTVWVTYMFTLRQRGTYNTA